MMDLVSRAVIFAVKAHDGMHRKNAVTPYILHPMEAAAIVGSMTDQEETIAAAVLHDVVEDTPVTMDEIEAQFGPRIASLVGADTEDKREHLPPEQTWRIRKEESIAYLRRTTDREEKILFLGDKLANMRSIYQQWRANGDAMWQIFNQKDPAQHGWYYRAIADAIPELKDTLAWQEYDGLIRSVFEKGQKQ